MTTAVLAPLVLDSSGVAYIEGTGLKVIELVRASQSTDGSRVQLKEAFPHLSLEQVYAALSYYHGHQAELDTDLERRDRLVEQLRAKRESTPSPVACETPAACPDAPAVQG
jgi:uncharacterized protein (DUF433 family)